MQLEKDFSFSFITQNNNFIFKYGQQAFITKIAKGGEGALCYGKIAEICLAEIFLINFKNTVFSPLKDANGLIWPIELKFWFNFVHRSKTNVNFVFELRLVPK